MIHWYTRYLKSCARNWVYFRTRTLSRTRPQVLVILHKLTMDLGVLSYTHTFTHNLLLFGIHDKCTLRVHEIFKII